MSFYETKAPLRSSDTIFEKTDKLVSTLGMLGVTLIGAGALLAVGANFDFIMPVFKLAVIAMVMLAAYVGGWYLRSPAGGKPRVGEALVFLGTMMYGVGIWQVAQSYGYEIKFAWGVLLWALGIIPVAIVASSGFIAVLACSLLNYWLMMEPYSLANAAVWAVLSFGLAYLVRSPWALAKGLVGAVFWLVDQAHLGAGGLVYFGLAMCSSYLVHANVKGLSEMSKPFLYIGSFVTLLSLLFLTDDRGRFLYSEGMDGLPSVFVKALLVVSLLAASRFWSKVYPEILGCIFVACAALGLGFVGDNILHSGLAHGLLMLTIILFVACGTLRLKSTIMMAICSTFFTIAVSVLYFDNTFSMSDRAMYLVGGGALLSALAFYAERILRGERLQSRAMNHAARSVAL